MSTINDYSTNISKNIYSNFMLSSIIEQLPIGVMVLDNQFNITIFNSIQESITKMNYESVINKNFFDIFPYLFSIELNTRLKNIFDTGESISITEFPFYNSKDNKNYIYINININVLKTEKEGHQIILFTMEKLKEIESIKVKEKVDLPEQDDIYYRNLIEFLPAAIFLHIEGKIIFCNSATAKLLGFDSPEELIGREICSFISPECREIVIKRIELVQKYGKSAPLIEEKFIKADGTNIYIQATSGRFPYKGIMASLSVALDISEHKKAEELQKKIKENYRLLSEAKKFDILKTEFFTNISHELRTPLNVILGAIQLLNYYHKIGINEEKSDQYLNSIKQNCFRILRLINNLIDITKMDSGYFEITPSNYNIVNIVENITLSVAEYAENKSINLIFDTDVEEKFISCDPDKIERIMLNLISNSIKFTNSNGSIFINIYDKGDHVIISVKDTGIGIPEDNLSIIFERFRQANKSLARNREGSGIGLSLVKSLVEMHGGKISVKSSWGKGSEFIISLPSVTTSESISSFPNNPIMEDYAERINIEFSDIYP